MIILIPRRSRRRVVLGFVDNEDEQLKVNISNAEVDRLIKEYKKIKKRQKSNLNQIRLLDKFGNPIKKP